jgi:transcription elongation factor SPT4
MSDEGLLNTIVPKAGKQLRACLVCKLIKTPQQFQVNGCENCTFLRLNEDPEAIEECTTTNFDGYVKIQSYFLKILIYWYCVSE